MMCDVGGGGIGESKALWRHARLVCTIYAGFTYNCWDDYTATVGPATVCMTAEWVEPWYGLVSVCPSVPSCDRNPDMRRVSGWALCVHHQRHWCTGHSTALSNVISVKFTADVGIRKLKSDLFLQAIITAFLKGGCRLVT